VAQRIGRPIKASKERSPEDGQRSKITTDSVVEKNCTEFRMTMFIVYWYKLFLSKQVV